MKHVLYITSFALILMSSVIGYAQDNTFIDKDAIKQQQQDLSYEVDTLMAAITKYVYGDNAAINNKTAIQHTISIDKLMLKFYELEQQLENNERFVIDYDHVKDNSFNYFANVAVHDIRNFLYALRQNEPILMKKKFSIVLNQTCRNCHNITSDIYGAY